MAVFWWEGAGVVVELGRILSSGNRTYTGGAQAGATVSETSAAETRSGRTSGWKKK